MQGISKKNFTIPTRILTVDYIPGWTLAADSNFTLNFTMPTKFTDDAKMSDFAKASVYLIAVNGIKDKK